MLFPQRIAIRMSTSKSNDGSATGSGASPIDYETFRKSFDKAYIAWSRTNSITPELRSIVESYELTADEFEKLITNRQLQRYIALIDGKIRFDEPPGPPLGEIIGKMIKTIGRQLDGPNDVEILDMPNDNGILSYSMCLRITTDVRVSNRSVKRPDASFKVRRPLIPAPPPNWLKMQPNGHPYPNLVIEVAVNNEGPQLLDDMQRYFSRRTSIRVGIGVKYWTAGRKFWVGWAERRPGGLGGRLHTQMQWPPNHHDISTATNIIYNIPMATIYGPNIPMPPGLSPSLNIDTDVIRMTILENV